MQRRNTPDDPVLTSLHRLEFYKKKKDWKLEKEKCPSPDQQTGTTKRRSKLSSQTVRNTDKDRSKGERKRQDATDRSDMNRAYSVLSVGRDSRSSSCELRDLSLARSSSFTSLPDTASVAAKIKEDIQSSDQTTVNQRRVDQQLLDEGVLGNSSNDPNAKINVTSAKCWVVSCDEEMNPTQTKDDCDASKNDVPMAWNDDFPNIWNQTQDEEKLERENQVMQKNDYPTYTVRTKDDPRCDRADSQKNDYPMSNHYLMQTNDYPNTSVPKYDDSDVIGYRNMSHANDCDVIPSIPPGFEINERQIDETHGYPTNENMFGHENNNFGNNCYNYPMASNPTNRFRREYQINQQQIYQKSSFSTMHKRIDNPHLSAPVCRNTHLCTNENLSHTSFQREYKTSYSQYGQCNTLGQNFNRFECTNSRQGYAFSTKKVIRESNTYFKKTTLKYGDNEISYMNEYRTTLVQSVSRELHTDAVHSCVANNMPHMTQAYPNQPQLWPVERYNNSIGLGRGRAMRDWINKPGFDRYKGHPC